MAEPLIMNGEQLLIQIGDGASLTEVFAADCLINAERGIQFSNSTNDTVVPDCTDPSLPGWIKRNKDGLSATINGSGKIHTTSLLIWFNFFKGKATKNVRTNVNVLLAAGGGYWQGAFHLTGFDVTGPRLDISETSVTLMSSGPLTWTPAAA